METPHPRVHHRLLRQRWRLRQLLYLFRRLVCLWLRLLGQCRRRKGRHRPRISEPWVDVVGVRTVHDVISGWKLPATASGVNDWRILEIILYELIVSDHTRVNQLTLNAL